MKAIVVYESLWGNTARIAQAIAEGIGPDARVVSTAEATPDELAECDLIVAGAPSHMPRLPFMRTRASTTQHAYETPQTPPLEMTQPAMREWLESLPNGSGLCAGFDTRAESVWTAGPAKRIVSSLGKHGYQRVGKPQAFLLASESGPAKVGELEHARAWGRQLADAAREAQA